MKRCYFILHLKQLTFYGCLMLLIVLLILQSNQVITAIQNALLLCYKTVIPSLFPFFVLVGMLTSGSFIKKVTKWLSPCMKPLFRVSGTGALPFAIGIISGYPMGAKMTTELYQKGAITKEEAMRLLPFTNNSGPLFIIGAVGVGMLKNINIGIFLYIIHILSALLVGLCFRFYKAEDNSYSHHTSFSSSSHTPTFSEVMTSSVNTMILICGFIVFFSAVSACLSPIIDRLGNTSLYIKSILEVTNGAHLMTQTDYPTTITISLLSFIIGFGGICVMLQVAGITSPAGLSLKSYVYGKTLQGILAAALSFCLYPLFPDEDITVFAVSPQIAVPQITHYLSFVSALMLLWIFLFFLAKLKSWLRTAKK